MIEFSLGYLLFREIKEKRVPLGAIRDLVTEILDIFDEYRTTTF